MSKFFSGLLKLLPKKIRPFKIQSSFYIKFQHIESKLKRFEFTFHIFFTFIFMIDMHLKPF
jgi:hypothetical protein